jgi:hypothetical protein
MTICPEKIRILSKERMDVALRLISEGNYITVSCKAAGITKQTFYLWLERADNHDYDSIPYYKQFKQQVEQAEAMSEAAILREARNGSREAIPILERRWPDRWGRKERQDINQNVIITVKAEELTDDQLAAVVAGRSGHRTIAPPPVSPALN